DEEDMQRQQLKLPKGVDVYEINGPFFFGIAHKFNETIRTIKGKTKVRILRMRRVPFIDATALNNLKNLYYKSLKSGEHLILSGVGEQPLKVLKTSGLYDLLGAENVCVDIYTAVKQAETYLARHQHLEK
ncbi:MAG TPA: sodium-independent anion transporter, partial [bacterium]|nr:sodium-independent anion transporter [bacterium]